MILTAFVIETTAVFGYLMHRLADWIDKRAIRRGEIEEGIRQLERHANNA